ncbi:MAG: hypothetical protein ACPGOY_04330 [Rhodospirillaceae bacterium]
MTDHSDHRELAADAAQTGQKQAWSKPCLNVLDISETSGGTALDTSETAFTRAS